MAERAADRRLLLVEAHDALRLDLASALTRSGFEVDAVASAREATAGAEPARYAARIVDPRADGVAEWLEVDDDFAHTIVLASDPDAASPAEQALLSNADCLYKPFSIHALETRLLERIGRAADERVGASEPLLETREPALTSLFARARRLARGDVSICIEGELGTGRRALAAAIHDWSPRSGHPRVVLERAELESERVSGMARILEAGVAGARGGTLVLIEPAELPLPGQEALLERLRAVSAETASGVSAGYIEAPRLITISRRPLEQSAREGKLSLELQYRLDTARLEMPPLRARERDRLDLCRAVARRVARELGQPSPEIDPALAELLARDGFPGNRLGLESRLRSVLIRSQGALTIDSLLREEAPRVGEAPGALPSLNLKTLERDTIVRALAHWDGNRTRASEALGISVRTLRNKIRDYGLR